MLDDLIARLRMHRSWRDSHGELNNAPLEAATALEALRAERDALKAENEHLSKVVASRLLPGLLEEDEQIELVNFIKELRAGRLT